MDIDVSIVMAYYNRRPLLFNTLRGLESQKNDGLEIVIVDDGSASEHEIFDVCDLFDLNIKLLRIEPESKRINCKYFPVRLNSCVPYNLGFINASGQKIIMQCPECIHNGNIIEYTKQYLGKRDYFVFATYSINEAILGKIMNGENPAQAIKPINNRIPSGNGDTAWYAHSVYNPTMLHFCSAITKADLYDLGGFDERYAEGLAYEDNELLMRIRKKRMKVVGIDEPFVIHQFHHSMFTESRDKMSDMMRINGERFFKTPEKESYDVKKYNKIFT